MSLLEQVLLHCHRILDHSQMCILMSFIGFRKRLIIYFLQIVLLPHYLFGRPITYMLELFTMSQNPTYLSYCLYFLIFSLCVSICVILLIPVSICSSVLLYLSFYLTYIIDPWTVWGQWGHCLPIWPKSCA